MFRSFVYLDEEKVYSYLRLLDSEYITRSTEFRTKKTKGGRFGVAKIGLNKDTEIEERK